MSLIKESDAKKTWLLRTTITFKTQLVKISTLENHYHYYD